MMPNDAVVQNHGSIFILRPITSEAEDWCQEYLPNDGPMWGDAYVVEHRYIGDIITGMREDGLTVGRA